MIAVAIAGWLVAALLGGALVGARGRLELIARAEHELRGPVTTLSLAAGSELQTEVDRLRVALDDLAAARTGGRALAQAGPVALDELVQGAARSWRPVAIRAGGGVEVDWRAGPVSVRADRRRLSQVLGNLLANAVEHGHGRIELRGRRTPSGVRVEVADSGPGFGTTARQARAPQRGRGLLIAERAVADLGGRLVIDSSDSGGVVAVEMPVGDR